MDKLKDFYSDYTKHVWTAFIALVAILIGGYMIALEKGAESDTDMRVDATRDFQLVIARETFSELEVFNTGMSEKRPALIVKLFLKKPFLDTATVTGELNNYVQLLKYKYNDESADILLAGVSIEIYDRIENYDRGTSPRATAAYQLSAVDKDTIAKMQGLSMETILWETSITQKDIDYRKYKLSTNYRGYDMQGYSPLSNAEYQLLHKLQIYHALTGSFQGGINTYLTWEWGIPSMESQYLVALEFEDFYAYAQSYGENMSLYDGREIELLETYAVRNPRLVAYVKLGRIFEGKLDAKKALVASDRDTYLPLYVQEAQEMVQGLSAEEGKAVLTELSELQSVTDGESYETDPMQDEEDFEEEAWE